MKGKLYCVGVGPGDPELVTIKALRVMEEADVIAYPYADKDAKDSTAYEIAAAASDCVRTKESLPIYSPMVLDADERMKYHRMAAASIEALLDAGKSVAYLTLGDPTVYCTYTPLRDLLAKDGHLTEYIPGVTSFCAVAARLGISLADGAESLKIIPAAVGLSRHEEKNNLVFMKAASRMKALKESELLAGRQVYAVTDCGMETEKIYCDVKEIPDDAGYFTVVVAR
ncbi:MAG: precorrin-2 C(20)-methyltransferase [Lachnospiraceae bacterium]|nr:precorrin-2 C(20)-methyltransferase [Lachnospiraceae bacterium]